MIEDGGDQSVKAERKKEIEDCLWPIESNSDKWTTYKARRRKNSTRQYGRKWGDLVRM